MESATATEKSADVAMTRRGGIPDEHATDIMRELSRDCEIAGARFLQASHSNHAHFQQDLLMSLRVWHFTAVSLGQRESNFYGALIISAISDHYLQDFFAPGHIVTARDRLTDLQATASHDLANQMGAMFVPRLSPRMLSVLEFICASNSQESCTERPELAQVLRNVGRRVKINKVQTESQALRNGLPVLLRGDNWLTDEAQARQRLLILLVQVQSILDVLDGANNITHVNFDYVLGDGGGVVASTDFGSYNFSHAGAKHAGLTEEKLPHVESIENVKSAFIETSKFTGCSLTGCFDRLYAMRTRSPVISVSDERASQSSGAYNARNIYSIEFSAGGYLWDASRFSGRWLSGVEFTPIFGYSMYKQGLMKGNGPSLRLMASIPETEFSIGPYYRRLSYPLNGDSRRKSTVGLRAEAGFSSYLTFYVSGGVDYGNTIDGNLKRGRMWGGGVRIGAPTSRLSSMFD